MVADLRANLLTRSDEVVEALTRRMDRLAALERFEEASSQRDRLASFVRAASRSQRLSALTRCAEIVAARRNEGGRWEVHVLRYGRLAAAGVIPPNAHAGDYVATLRSSADTVIPGLGPTPAASAEESDKILSWLEEPGVRLVHVEGEWSCPVRGASRHLHVYDSTKQAQLSVVPFDDRRVFPTVHQPAR